MFGLREEIASAFTPLFIIYIYNLWLACGPSRAPPCPWGPQVCASQVCEEYWRRRPDDVVASYASVAACEGALRHVGRLVCLRDLDPKDSSSFPPSSPRAYTTRSQSDLEQERLFTECGD